MCSSESKVSWISLLLVISTANPSRSANILAIFPSPSRSHHIVFHALVEGLLERGHSLTVMTTDPIKTNSSRIRQIDWSYVYDLVDPYNDVAKTVQEKWSALRTIEQLLFVVEMFMEAELSHPEVQEMIQNPSESFDVVIVECFQMTPFFAFAELFNAPLIGITSIESILLIHGIIGNVNHALAHPEQNQKITKDHDWFQRLDIVITQLFTNYFLFPREFAKYDQIIERHFGGNMTKSLQLLNRIDFLMTNVEPALGFIRPTVPQAIQLGFLHIKPPKALPNELQQYLDESEHGVIYFSFGTLIKTGALSRRNVELFKSVFQSLDYDVLWKCDSVIDLNGTSNIRMEKWLPQQDLLAHPKVKLFVTQGGQQSMEEAVDRHVPMVVIPFNFDQFSNGDRVVERGIGKSIWMERLTAEGLREAILEVIGNRSYKRNIERLGRLVRDQPMRPLEKAIWWTEYVIRHQGASHLRYKQAQMPSWKYNYYDVVGVLLVASVVVFVLVVYIVKRIVMVLFRRKWFTTMLKQKLM